MEGEYYKTKESVEEYIQMAKDVDSGQLIEKFNAVLPSKSTVLEIGSGPGTDWKILSQSFEVTGSDFSQEFLDHLHETFPNGKFLNLDAISLTTDLKFDGIYANKVMHHLTDEELKVSVKRQSEILNSGGAICHSFWKGEGSEIFKGLFVNYHTASSLRAAYEQYFDIVLMESYKEFEDDDSILLIATKKA